MCGIAGIVHLDGAPVDAGELDRLTDALRHRGPDGRGTHIAGYIGLGHRRLRIIDLSEAAAQPMMSDDRQCVVTFNGEIYNFLEKRSELEAKGYRFRSKSDTEVLLKLYEEYGTDCLKHLRGMFAFAILDQRRRRLFLARDRVGKKPLKYFFNGITFAFASELKALRTLQECPRGLDEEAIHHFLTMMYVPAPGTGFDGIRKLPAGHSLTLDLQTGRHSIAPYWRLSYEADEHPTLAEWEERIAAVFEESVRLRMIADVPLGAFLSGGLDSAAVVALMSRFSPHPVKTFSIGTQDASFNELPHAAMTAKAFGTDHHPIVVEPDIVHLLPELVAAYEEPYADPSAIPTFLIARETRKTVTVALNGDGGDENFAGYIRYPILLFSERWRRMPGIVHALARGATTLFLGFMQSTFSERCLRFEGTIGLPWEERYLQYLCFFTEEEKRGLYRTGFADNFPRTDAWYADHTKGARGRAGDLLHRAMSMDLATYLPDDLLPKVDLGTMAHALEARSPFLDHELLELTARMPARWKLRGWRRKWILRHRLLKGILPPAVLARRKTGFRLPLDRWFRTDLRSFVADRLLTSDPAFHALMDRRALERFLVAYHTSRIDKSDRIWALLWLQEWLKQYG